MIRYFRFAVGSATQYELMRAAADATLSISTSIEPAATAPIDLKGRILLAVNTSSVVYPALLPSLNALLSSGVAEELSEGDYWASFEQVIATGGGGVSSWNDLTDRPFSTLGSGVTVVSGALTVPSYSRRFAWSSPYSYSGRAASGSATSAAVWTIKRTQIATSGTVTATLTATNVAWDDYATATYS